MRGGLSAIPSRGGGVARVSQCYNVGMTKTLEQAIERLRQMPEERQELLARLLLHEMEQDDLWSRTTEKYADKLNELVKDILAADDRGECEPLDPDKL
jgi:hypothetical protein